jgi:signal transduction histidine kinase
MKLLITLLAGTLFLTVFLAYQAKGAARMRREAAAQVVRDYAALCADELVDRAGGDIVYRGIYHAMGPMGRLEDARPMQALPSDKALAAEVSDPAALSLVKHRFRFDLQGDGVAVSEGTPPVLRHWLHDSFYQQVRSETPSMSKMPIHHVRVGGKPYTLVYAVPPPERRPHRVAIGFVLRDEALTPYLEHFYDSTRLLPHSLGGLDNNVLSVTLRDREGRLLLRRGGAFDPALGVQRKAQVAAAELFTGSVAELSIDREATPKLVIGGIRSGNDRALLVAVISTMALLTAAVVLMRREQRLARLRSDFVAGVSHELRTPLTQIHLFAQTLLLERTRNDEERWRSLRIIDQEARRLAHLVDNTLLFTRGERGRLRLAKRDDDLVAVTAQTMEAFSPIAAARGVVMKLEGEASLPALFDPEAIRQIVVNLLDNAVKYGPRDGTIVVTVVRGAAGATLAVEDEGPGIPRRSRRAIFRRFARLPRDASGATGGAGVGLAVVHELVALHGGRCGVEDRSGGGSRFFITLPAGRDAPLQGPA